MLFMPFCAFSEKLTLIPEELQEFKTNELYIVIESGYHFGKQEIKSYSDSRLAAFPELKKLMESGEIHSIHQEFQILAGKSDLFSRVYKLHLQNGAVIEQILLQLEKSEHIILAEKVPVYKHFYTPNDPDYSDSQKRWHLDQISASNAWNITLGCTSVKIAVVDDAVLTTHNDLSANIYTNTLEIPNNGIDDDQNGYIDDVNGYDVADSDNNVNPPNTVSNTLFTHGTHVAGLAAAVSDNNTGTSSIGFNSVIIPVKTKSNNNLNVGALNNPIQGVEYAIAAGADVINMSWGTYVYSQVDRMLFEYADSLGIVCVAGVGNDAIPFSAFPANYPTVISVGATDSNDELTTFSNHNELTDVFAPGENIWSCLATGNNSYGYRSGTSMSTPIVSGLVALMLCNDPLFKPFQIRECLRNSADYFNSNIAIGLSMARINADNTLQCAIPVMNVCETSSCELIRNGDFEMPRNNNTMFYNSAGAFTFNQVCGWDDYTSSADCFPLQVNGTNNYAHIQCHNNQGTNHYESIVTTYPLDIVPGQTYQIQFDYSVLKNTQSTQANVDHFDSILVKLVHNDWEDTIPWVGYIVDPNYLLGYVENPTVDFTYPDWSTWVSNAILPNQYWHHASMTFVAPSDTSIRKLIIHPIADYPNLIQGFSTLGLCIDNVSVKPIIDVVASASNLTPTSTDCITLTATTNASMVYWEPDHLFSDPYSITQNFCLDTMNFCQGGDEIFVATAFDTISNCTTSDTVIISVQGIDLVSPVPNEPILDTIFSCNAVNYIATPTSNDNCDGTITGITGTQFPITTSTNVVWSYTDISGNTAMQNQVVEISSPFTTISSNGVTITADSSGYDYQWMNCTTGQIIPNETGQSFSPTVNGNYAVIVSLNGCSDTSLCTTTSLGLSDHGLNYRFEVYPNPTNGQVTLEFFDIQDEVTIRLTDLSGRVVESGTFADTKLINFEIKQAAGVYMLEIFAPNDQKSIVKVVKN